MSTNVVFKPSTLDLGIFGPGNTKPFVSIVSASVPVTATMSASLANDTSNGGFHIIELESSIVVDVDPGDPEFPILKGKDGKPLPPGKTLQVLSSSDGSHPIPVSQGSDASVAIMFKAPDPPSAEIYSATLIIIGDTWNPVSINLSARSAGIVTRILTPAINAVQGQTVSAQIEVISKSGPATDVRYEMFPAVAGISLIPKLVHVNPGTQTISTLTFAIDINADVGPRQIDIVESAFNDEQRDSLLQGITVTVLLGPVLVGLAQEPIIQLRPGQTGNILLNITTQAGGTAVTLIPENAPSGFKLSQQTVQMSPQTSSRIALPFSVDRDAPRVTGSGLTIRWTAADGQQSGSLALTVNIKPETKCFHSGDLGPSTVTGSASLCINSDGYFQFSGQIEESGFLGHNYLFGMAINVIDQTGKALGWANGGTVSGTTDLLGSRNDTWTQQNFDQRIVDNWDKIKESNSQSTLHVSTDPLQVIEALGEAALLELAVRLVVAGIVLLATNPEVVVVVEIISDSAGGVGADLVVKVPIK